MPQLAGGVGGLRGSGVPPGVGLGLGDHARQVLLGEDQGNELAAAAGSGLVEDGFQVLLHGERRD